MFNFRWANSQFWERAIEKGETFVNDSLKTIKEYLTQEESQPEVNDVDVDVVQMAAQKGNSKSDYLNIEVILKKVKLKNLLVNILLHQDILSVIFLVLPLNMSKVQTHLS